MDINNSAYLAGGGTLVILHILVVTRRFSWRFWRSLDYVWILIGAFALVPATGAADRQYAVNVLGGVSQNFSNVLDNAIDVSTTGIELCQYRLSVVEQFDPGSVSEHYKCLFYFETARKMLSYRVESGDWRQAYSLRECLPRPSSRELLSYIERLTRAIDDLESADVFLRETEKHLDDPNDNLVFYHVWLLAIAIALRLSLVTANFYGLLDRPRV